MNSFTDAAEDAAEQNKFCEMHDHLYERQQALEDEHLQKYTAKLGLDLATLNNDMSTRMLVVFVEYTSCKWYTNFLYQWDTLQ